VGLSMDSRLHGSLGESLFPDLIREIARRGASGMLRLSRDNAARSIYFDSGSPVSLTSELADEQLENLLLKEGRTTADLIQAARRAQPRLPLSRALIDEGVMSEEAVRLTTDGLVRQIVLSIFESGEGDYDFEEGADRAKTGVLEFTPADLIRGARHAAGIERLAQLIAPPDLLLAPTDTNNYFLASLPGLSSVESYVLSRVESPMSVSDASRMMGLPEEETHRTVCVLVALGLLARAGHVSPGASEQTRTPPDPLLAAISRKLQLFEFADYYTMLGVDKFATAGTVAQAFEELERMFRSYRVLSPDNKELHSNLDALYLKVKEAYQTLRDPAKRWAYDRTAAQSTQASAPFDIPNPVQKGSDGHSSSQELVNRGASVGKVFGFDSIIEHGEPQARRQVHVPIPNSAPIEASLNHLQTDIQPPRRAPIPGLATAPIESPTAPPGVKLSDRESSQQSNQPQWVKNAQTALHFYRQGRARYEERDVNGANHLFREACKLDPSQPHYHFYLAMTLLILSQARRAHAHHEGCHVTCSLGGALVSNPRMRYEAEHHLLRAAELDPGNPQIPLRLGLLFKEAGLAKKAEHYFQETLMRDSKNKTALFELESLEEALKHETNNLTEQTADD
jgi:tetratricopeptide (TPR) repeat protein